MYGCVTFFVSLNPTSWCWVSGKTNEQSPRYLKTDQLTNQQGRLLWTPWSKHEVHNFPLLAILRITVHLRWCSHYEDRVFFPESLRPVALAILHSAHQCISDMEAPARSFTFGQGSPLIFTLHAWFVNHVIVTPSCRHPLHLHLKMCHPPHLMLTSLRLLFTIFWQERVSPAGWRSTKLQVILHKLAPMALLLHSGLCLAHLVSLWNCRVMVVPNSLLTKQSNFYLDGECITEIPHHILPCPIVGLRRVVSSGCEEMQETPNEQYWLLNNEKLLCAILQVRTRHIQSVTFSLYNPSETPSHSWAGSLTMTTLASSQFGKRHWLPKRRLLRLAFQGPIKTLMLAQEHQLPWVLVIRSLSKINMDPIQLNGIEQG